MAVATSLRIALVLILVPAVAASSGGDAFSNNLFSGVTPLLALFGQDFANYFLSQSTSWLDSIIFAMGPLGIPAAIVAAIRVGGYSFLKGLIGRAGERESTVEKDLLSSTSRDVCELWDGKKVVRIEATDPFVQLLLYFGEKDEKVEGWYNLREAKDANRKLLLKEKGHGDEENRQPESKGQIPPNILLNLIGDSRSREQFAGAILGIVLQSTVLIVAGLTTFYPPWRRQFSVQLYEFYCMAVGTSLLAFGLIICASVVEQRTQEEIYRTYDGKKVSILWVQRGRTDTDQSFDPYIFGVDQNRIWTSRLATKDPTSTLKLWTLVGTVAAALGFVLQFIGLVRMHWPTQAAQFTITLIMTSVRAFIRRAPQPHYIYKAIENEPNAISDKHEIDWLATKPKEKSIVQYIENQHIEPWQLMAAGCLSEVPKEGNDQQLVLERRQRLGALCEWTGMARKWAISLATAIDGVTDILLPRTYRSNNFTWHMDVKVGETTQRVSFQTGRSSNSPSWKSNFTQLEAALSLGLFGDKFLEYKLNRNRSRDENQKKSKRDRSDWLRSSESMQRKKRSVRLLGPSTIVALRDLTWWIGPQTRKLKEISLCKDENKGVKIGAYRIGGFGTLESIKEARSFSVEPYRIAGFWDTVDKSALKHDEEESDGPSEESNGPSERWCFAAVSEVDVGLLYAQHMFSAFMQAISKKTTKFSKAAIEKKWKFIPSDGYSWDSIHLSEKNIEDLALCVQRAGLADLEDAYLSIIAPLSKEAKLPSLEEIFDTAWETAIHKQSKEKWGAAARVYEHLWKTFVTSNKQDEMAIKTTAVVMEFCKFLRRKTQAAVALDESETTSRSSRVMKDDYNNIKEMLKTADGGVLNDLVDLYVDLYAMQGWPEVRDELTPNRENTFQPKTPIQHCLKQNEAHYAALRGGYIIRRMLKSQDKSNMSKDLFGRTFLHYLLNKRGELEISSEEFKSVIQPMLECIDDRDRYGMTALHAAAERGNAKLVGVLVEHGADKNKTFQSKTALHIAAELGHLDVVRKLVELSADTGVETLREWYTPLHLALLGGHGDVVSELLKKESADAGEIGRWALHSAVETGNKLILERLLEHDNVTSFINDWDERKWTALFSAAGNGHTESVRVLLKKGAALDAASEYERTALHVAASRGDTQVMRVLLKEAVRQEGSRQRGGGNSQDELAHTHTSLLQGGMRAFVDAKDFQHKTALQYALEYGHKWPVRLLLKYNAAYEMDEIGMETLASCLDHKEAVGTLLHALLLRKRPAFDVTDTGRKKALHWWKQNGRPEEIVKRVLRWLQEAVMLEMPPPSAAIEPTEEAVCVFLQAVLRESGINGTNTDTSGSIAQSQRAETELTTEAAEVLKVVNSIEGLLLRISQSSD